MELIWLMSAPKRGCLANAGGITTDASAKCNSQVCEFGAAALQVVYFIEQTQLQIQGLARSSLQCSGPAATFFRDTVQMLWASAVSQTGYDVSTTSLLLSSRHQPSQEDPGERRGRVPFHLQAPLWDRHPQQQVGTQNYKHGNIFIVSLLVLTFAYGEHGRFGLFFLLCFWLERNGEMCFSWCCLRMSNLFFSCFSGSSSMGNTKGATMEQV